MVIDGYYTINGPPKNRCLVRLKTILNNTEKYSSFVFGDSKFCNDYENRTFPEKSIVIEVRPRKNGKPVCSGCEVKGARCGYTAVRLFEHVPIYGHKVFYAYKMRRVKCVSCGVTVEKVPWAEGKKEITNSFEWFLAQWAKDLSWKKTAEKFGTSWDTVCRAVQMAVAWGLFHRDLSKIKAIGVDEIARQKGHKYTTLVYQIDEDQKRLLWVGDRREEETLDAFFIWFGKEKTEKLEAICSDMWKPYLKVIKKRAGNAIHVLDRFHIMSNMGKAIDKVRAAEARKMESDGYEPLLKKSRYLLLKRPENLTEKQEAKLSDLVKYNLSSVRAYLLKEDFQNFWNYKSKAWAGKFLDSWCTRTMRSKIEPMKDIAKMIRRHKSLILNWFEMKGKISSGIVEGFNTKAKLTTRKSFGFKSYKIHRIALLHQLGDLPVPSSVNKYC